MIENITAREAIDNSAKENRTVYIEFSDNNHSVLLGEADDWNLYMLGNLWHYEFWGESPSGQWRVHLMYG